MQFIYTDVASVVVAVVVNYDDLKKNLGHLQLNLLLK